MSTPGSRLLARGGLRLLTAIERLLERTWPARVQRLGAQALQRVAARFPAVAELIGSLRPTRPRAAAPVEPPTPHTPARPVEPDVASAIARLTGDAPWPERCDAATQLASFDHPQALDALLAALRDPSAEVAAAAIAALASRADVRVVAALREILENRDGYFSPVTRAASVQGLAQVLRGGDLSPVIEAVQDLDAEVSLAAIAALAEHAPELASQHLLAVLENSSGFFLPLVRLGAARALVKVDALPHDAATRLLMREQDPSVRDVLVERASTAAHA